MKTFRSRWIRYGSAALYILLSFLSFYCACYKLPVGLKYGINLVVFAWACAAFFVSPQFEHALFCLRFFVLFFFPYLMFWMWSAGIWITEFQSWPYILRGSQNIIYMLTNLLYVIGAVYLFDEDATTYTLISMACKLCGFCASRTTHRFSPAYFRIHYVAVDICGRYWWRSTPNGTA